MKKMIFTPALLLLIIFPQCVQSENFLDVPDLPSESKTSWTIGNLVCADTVHIHRGEVVDIGTFQDYSVWNNPIHLVIEGTLRFTCKEAKLKLPEGSNVIVNPDGLIASSEKGGGNCNKIYIGKETYWKKGYGDMEGTYVSRAITPIDYSSKEEVLVVVRDVHGNENYTKITVINSNAKELEAIDNCNKLDEGTYLIVSTSKNDYFRRKVVIKEPMLVVK